MRYLENKLGAFDVKYRWMILCVTLLLVVLTSYGGSYLKFTSDYRIYFENDNPQLTAFENIERTYAKNDNVLITITPKDGNVFTNDTLALIETFTEKAWHIPYSTRVDSITNFQHTEAVEDDVVVRDLVKDAANLSPQTLLNVREIALKEPILVNRLVSKTGDITAINVTVHLPGVDETVEVPEVMVATRSLAEQIRLQNPTVEVHITGMVAMDNAFSESALYDMSYLIPVSFVVMMVLLTLILKGFFGSLITFFLILFSIATAMGLAGYLAMPVTPSIVSAPIIILTVALANSVHILVTFYDEMRSGMQKNEAIKESIRINFQPVFLTSFTTAIGFLTMNFSEVPPFQHLGNLVATGVAVAFLLSVSFLPAMLAILPLKVPVSSAKQPDYMMVFADWVVKHKQTLLITMVCVVVSLSVFIPKNELNDIFVEYFDERVEFRTDTDYVTEHLTGLYGVYYSLDSGEESGVSAPGFLADIDAFKLWLEQQPEVLHVNSITSTFKRLNKNMHADDPSAYHLPESKALAAQYLLLYEMSLPYGINLNDQINVDKSATRLLVSLRTLSTQQSLEFEKKTLAWLAENAKNIASAELGSPMLMFSHIAQRNVISMLIGTSLALVLISFILMFALRSVKIGLVSLVPNLVPAAMAFGLWGLTVGEVGLALSIVLGMTLGIVVDDSVHFLSKYLRAKREKNLNAEDAVRYAFRHVGRALLFTSVILVVGFLILATSSFKLNSDMGLLSAIVIVFALIADFLLLPALLIKLEETKKSQARFNKV